MITIEKCAYAYGTLEPKPTRGFPPGKLRLRMRTREFVRARVKTPDGIEEFAVKEQDGFWVPAHVTGSNLRTTSK